MEPIQSPRGTRDILPEKQGFWQLVRRSAEEIACQFNFQPITTPIYEDLNLFQRSLGEGTDVIDKELFLVRGKQSTEEAYALRPEGTASIVRAYIEHGMQTLPQPVKLYSLVNCFRYERPQKGRYREHWQFDLECLGTSGPFADAWIIYTTWQFFQLVGLSDVQLKLNSLGLPEERARYIDALQKYLTPLQDQLSTDSQRRLTVNPLRILDSKEAKDQGLLSGAPQLSDFFGEESRQHFAAVQKYMKEWNIPFVLDSHLVRGLDYYSHTAFEWILTTSNSTYSLGGGGRYDGLLSQLGGPSTGAVGAGLGLDRIVEALEEKTAEKLKNSTEKLPLLFIAYADESSKMTVLSVLKNVLSAPVRLEASLDKPSLASQLKLAAKLNAQWTIIIGEEEVNTNTVIFKDMQTGEQVSIGMGDDLKAHFLVKLTGY